MKKELNELMNFDAVSSVEKMKGKRISEFTKEEKELTLTTMLFNNQNKKEMLKSLGDTHFGIEWKEFKNIVLSLGFEVDNSFKIVESDFDEEDEAVFFVNKEKGLILFAESYMGDRINTATLYGELRIDKKIEFKKEKTIFGEEVSKIVMTNELEEAYDALKKCSHHPFSNISKGMPFSYDCREGLVMKLEELSEHFQFNSIWEEEQFLWFLTYADKKEEGYDYKKINKERCEKCSEDLRKILGV